MIYRSCICTVHIIVSRTSACLGKLFEYLVRLALALSL